MFGGALTRVGIYAAIAIVLVGATWGYSAHQYSQGLKAGAAQERVAWEEANRKLREQMAAERRAAQAKIDEVERDFEALRDSDRSAIESLENTIRELENEDASGADSAGCRPTFDGRLLHDLAPIGRTK